MSAQIPEAAFHLFDGKDFAHLSIPRKDGSIQTVVIWIARDGQELIVNSAEGRAWPANLRRSGGATVSVHNAANPYEFVSVTCTLAGDTNESADDQIDALAKKYMDVDEYPFRQEGEQRVTFRLAPVRVTHWGAN
ncbi:MAG: TIGR03618 family F420-dependent PPOX class oxidoreductase [Baekduia sp.]